ncbi:SRSO17 transposase [Bradyrhizobium japonicum]
MTKSYRPPKGWAPTKRHAPNSARSARQHEPLTIERLERALAVCAYLIVQYGDRLTPIYDRLERELAAMRANDDTVVRAKRLLASYGGQRARFSLAPPTAEVSRS